MSTEVSNHRLDRDRIVEALSIMGRYLRDRRTIGEIAVYGGSAIVLQFDWRATTRDVDAVVRSEGNHGLVQKAADEAAIRLGLPRSWLSEGVSIYTKAMIDETSGDRIDLGMFPDWGSYGLRVTAARPEYLLAMKLSAMRRSTFDDRDVSDARHLAAEIGIDTPEALLELHAAYFPNFPLDPDVAFRLSEVVERREPPAP